MPTKDLQDWTELTQLNRATDNLVVTTEPVGQVKALSYKVTQEHLIQEIKSYATISLGLLDNKINNLENNEILNLRSTINMIKNKNKNIDDNYNFLISTINKASTVAINGFDPSEVTNIVKDEFKNFYNIDNLGLTLLPYLRVDQSVISDKSDHTTIISGDIDKATLNNIADNTTSLGNIFKLTNWKGELSNFVGNLPQGGTGNLTSDPDFDSCNLMYNYRYYLKNVGIAGTFEVDERVVLFWTANNIYVYKSILSTVGDGKNWQVFAI